MGGCCIMPETEHHKWGNATFRQCPVGEEQGTVLPLLSLVIFCMAACPSCPFSHVLFTLICVPCPLQSSVPCGRTGGLSPAQEKGQTSPRLLQALGRGCSPPGVYSTPSWGWSQIHSRLQNTEPLFYPDVPSRLNASLCSKEVHDMHESFPLCCPGRRSPEGQSSIRTRLILGRGRWHMATTISPWCTFGEQ